MELKPHQKRAKSAREFNNALRDLILEMLTAIKEHSPMTWDEVEEKYSLSYRTIYRWKRGGNASPTFVQKSFLPIWKSYAELPPKNLGTV